MHNKNFNRKLISFWELIFTIHGRNCFKDDVIREHWFTVHIYPDFYVIRGHGFTVHIYPDFHVIRGHGFTVHIYPDFHVIRGHGFTVHIYPDFHVIRGRTWVHSSHRSRLPCD